MTAPASLNGIPFSVNPSSIAWNYNVKLATTPTIGGKVVQLFGWSMGDLVISGSFGRNGVERQASFVQLLRSIADDQSPHVAETGAKPAKPVRFLWADQNWDFWVFVREIKQLGASVAVEASVQTQFPNYQLTLFVYEDNGQIVEAATGSAMVAYMKRLSAGLGWKQSEWNGPQNVEALQEVLKGQNFIEYAFTRYGLPELTSQQLEDLFGNIQGPSVGPGPGEPLAGPR